MDVEWAHAIAPKANIILIEANSTNFDDLLAAIETARNLAGRLGDFDELWPDRGRIRFQTRRRL